MNALTQWPSNQNLTNVVAHIAQSMPGLLHLVTASAYIIGLFLFWNALYRMKQYGQMQSMMSQDTDIRVILTMAVIATLLIYFPTTVKIAMKTFFGHGNILAYKPSDKTTYTTLIEKLKSLSCGLSAQFLLFVAG